MADITAGSANSRIAAAITGVTLRILDMADATNTRATPPARCRPGVFVYFSIVRGGLSFTVVRRANSEVHRMPTIGVLRSRAHP